MGSLNNTKSKLEFSGISSWFEEIHPVIFGDIPSSPEEDDEEIPLSQKRKIERVKKLIRNLKESEVILELGEFTEETVSLLQEICPLQAIAVLGALTHFYRFINENEKTEETIKNVEFFLGEQSKTKIEEKYFPGMKWILQDLKSESATVTDPDNVETQSTILLTKLHFLRIFPNVGVQTLLTLVNQIEELGSVFHERELKLLKYEILKEQRGTKSLDLPSQFEDLFEEGETLEKAFRTFHEESSETKPLFVLAKCSYLCDVLSSVGSPDNLSFCGEIFPTHTDVVKLIKSESEIMAERFPHFLRGYFVFADIFANALPITKQDPEWSRTLLKKALEANPSSAKIHHKLGLFLTKIRQFSEAEKHFKTAIDLDENSPLSYESLAKLLLRDFLTNRGKMEAFFGTEITEVVERIGEENELSFWKGCYFWKIGEPELAINIWIETILEFYVTKPELDLETVLPFQTLTKVSRTFHWLKNIITLEAIIKEVKEVGSMEKTRRRVVFNRLKDLVTEALIQ